jgi:hypothetical protein
MPLYRGFDWHLLKKDIFPDFRILLIFDRLFYTINSASSSKKRGQTNVSDVKHRKGISQVVEGAKAHCRLYTQALRKGGFYDCRQFG